MSGTEDEGKLGRSAAVTGVAQAVTMLAGGLLAVIVAVRIGNDARTDGFFAAFGVYSVAVLFAQASRTTIVARIVEPGAFDHYLGAVLVLWAGFGLLFVALGGPVTDLLTAGQPVAHETARTALLILWPAVGGQLFAALAAALLGTRGDYTTPAIAFGGGGLTSILAFLALESTLGIDALAVGILTGSLVTAGILATAMLRIGWRVNPRGLTRIRDSSRAAGVMALSSLPFLLSQLGFLITIAVAARLGQGVVTAYSYSNAAVGIIMALVASVPAIVLAGPLAVSWDRRPASLLPHHRAVWSAGLLVVAGLVAAAALVGLDVASFVLTKFTNEQVRLTIELFFYSVPVVACALAVSLPQTALFTLGRYRLVAVTSAGIVAIQVAIAILSAFLESAELMAAAVSISGAVSIGAYLYAFSPEYLRSALPMLTAGLARVGGLAVVCFGLPGLLLPGPAALVLGLALSAVGIAVALPYERELAGRMIAAFRRSRKSTEAGSMPPISAAETQLEPLEGQVK